MHTLPAALTAPVDTIMSRRLVLRTAHAAMTDPDVWTEPVARWRAHGVLALRPSDTVATAVEHLVDSGVRSLPVSDEDGRAIGIVSRNALITAIAQEAPA